MININECLLGVSAGVRPRGQRWHSEWGSFFNTRRDVGAASAVVNGGHDLGMMQKNDKSLPPEFPISLIKSGSPDLCLSAIYLDELSGWDQMGQKPFYIAGSHHRSNKEYKTSQF